MLRLVLSLASFAALVTLGHGADAEPVRDRLSLGIHLAGGGLSDANDEDAEAFDVGGAGLTARYSVSRRWDVELSIEGLGGETDALRRTLGIVTLAGRFRFNPTARWRWSALAGLGSATETAEVLDADAEPILTREFRHGVIVIGGGLERRFGRIGVAAELRVMGMVRDDEALDGPEFAGKDSPTPTETSAGEFRLAATYYF